MQHHGVVQPLHAAIDSVVIARNPGGPEGGTPRSRTREQAPIRSAGRWRVPFAKTPWFARNHRRQLLGPCAPPRRPAEASLKKGSPGAAPCDPLDFAAADAATIRLTEVGEPCPMHLNQPNVLIENRWYQPKWVGRLA